jgi:hypothetical protein
MRFHPEKTEEQQMLKGPVTLAAQCVDLIIEPTHR